MRYLMSETVQFSSILTLTSTYHVILTMNVPKNIFVVSTKQITELELIKIDPPILEILFSLDLCSDFANYGY